MLRSDEPVYEKTVYETIATIADALDVAHREEYRELVRRLSQSANAQEAARRWVRDTRPIP